MKGFIEVTQKDTNRKHLISVASIKYVCPENGIVHIALACVCGKKLEPWAGLCLDTTESYSEVLEKIKEAVK